MIASISEILETLRSEISSQTGSSVFVGAPDDSRPGLYLLAIHHGISPALRPPAAASAARPRRPGYSLECLMLPAPGDDFGLIDEGSGFLHDRPILEVNGTTAQLTFSELTPSEAAAVFDACAVRYRLYLSFRIRVEPSRAGASAGNP